MDDRSLADLHRLSVVKLNATDRLDKRAFRDLLGAVRLINPGPDHVHARAFAREAAEALLIYVEFTQFDDAELLILADAFEGEAARLAG